MNTDRRRTSLRGRIVSKASVRRTAALAIVVGILTLAPAAASAQGTGVLRGSFHDTSVDPSIPIQGATVFVTGPVTQTATTDATGSFRMVLPEGVYIFLITAPGYSPCGDPTLPIPAGLETVIFCGRVPLDADPTPFDSRGHGIAFVHRVEDIEAQIMAGDIAGAIDSLHSLRRKMDGCPDTTGTSPESDDWIPVCAGQINFRVFFDFLIASLGG
jgi:Carboxypeptidase regulatory-like domain